MVVLNKNIFSNKADDGGDPLRGQKIRDRKDRTSRDNRLLMPYLCIKNTTFKNNWELLMNLGSKYAHGGNTFQEGRLIRAWEEEVVNGNGFEGGPLDIIEQELDSHYS